MDVHRRLLEAFQVEHVEHLEAIRSQLATWAEQGGAPNVDEAFRRAHSLKGAARVTGFSAVEALAHQLENLFALLRTHALPADDGVAAAIHGALDAIEDSATCLLQGEPSPSADVAMERLERLLKSALGDCDHSGAPEALPPKLVDRMDRAAPPPCPLPAVNPSVPAAASGEEHSHSSDRTDEQSSSRAGLHAIDTVRLSAESLDRLLQSSGQLLIENLQQDVLARELNGIYQQLTALQREWEAAKQATASPLRRMVAASELSGLARYVSMVDHEYASLSRRLRSTLLLQQRTSWSMRTLAEQVHDEVREARMVPAESELQGFRKMMRDMARDQDKQLDFAMIGCDVLADRMVLQTLKDPLMHLLRNAVTHGVEPFADRIERGKPAAGRVTLRMQAAGNRLSIEVRDDGPGVDLEEVSRLAQRRGVLSDADVEAKSPSELCRVLMLPGLSTTKAVTEFAGRGMGLSAVHEAVSRLQGEVDIRPQAGGGVVVALTVPLSIATHRLLVVACGEQTVAIPFYGIESLHHVRPQDVETVEGLPMITIGGQLAPLVGLACLLDEGAADHTPGNESTSVILMRSGSKRLAVMVDALVAERDALIKDLGSPANANRRYLGGVLMENGSVALVINPADVVDRFKASKQGRAIASARSKKPALPPAILVVDDSFTTRTLETSILESHGYRVRVAVDGMAALEQLRTELVDLVITDVQMPRLDGFGLLEEIKRDPRLAKTPVIILSSVEGSEDQRRGLSLGADAYIVKRKFDHQDLIATVQQIL